MRLLIAMTLAALASTNSFGQDHPLDKLTVTSTRLKCLSGFAEVTYGYRRGVSEAAQTKLEFVVIETNKRTEFHLNDKVDDVTPPAYIAMAGSEHTVDLPNKNQLHELSGRRGRYQQADSDVTLGEIRAWLDQLELQATIKSLLDYKTKLRSADRTTDG